MIKFLLFFSLLLFSCTNHSWHDDIDSMKEEIARWEPPPDAPIFPHEFAKLVQDRTPIETDMVYSHIIRKLSRMPQDELKQSSEGDFDDAKCLASPELYRGKVWRVRGTIYNIEAHRFRRDSSLPPEIHQCVIYTKEGNPVVIHLTQKPDPLFLDEDTVQLEAVFLKLLSERTAQGDVVLPFLLGKGLRRYF